MQLLDCALIIIQDFGLSGFTMDGLAKQAGVSNPLIYKYFDTRLALLQELLIREYERFSSNITAQLKGTSDYRKLIKVAVTANFNEFSKGNILDALRGEADVFSAIKETEETVTKNIGYLLIKSLTEALPLSQEQALKVVVMSSGASKATAERYKRMGGDKKVLIEDTVRFILAGADELSR